uniref:DUF4255 domain-containing protein n=1 Tax=uncultured Sphingomonas sp. TaxID=158754 RepID=UPI0035CBBC5C
MNTAIRAAAETLRSVLLATMQADPILKLLFTGSGTSVVSLGNPDEMNDGGESGISLWLYRIERDDQRLNAPPERVAPNRIRPTPLPVRLHFLVCPMIGSDGSAVPVATRHHVLGAILQTFHETPLVSGALLSGDYSGTSVELAVRLENPGLEEIARLWDSLDAGYTLSVAYEVGIVSIETTAPDPLGPPVTIALPEYGVAEAAAI